MAASIKRFDSTGGKMLYLETHSSLATAIGLHESAGFIHAVAPAASEWAREDTSVSDRRGSKPLKSQRKPPFILARTTDPHKCAE